MPTAKPNSTGGLANPLNWRPYVAVTAAIVDLIAANG